MKCVSSHIFVLHDIGNSMDKLSELSVISAQLVFVYACLFVN